jgi:hypothetical protein
LQERQICDVAATTGGMPVFPTRATTTFTDCPTDVDVLFTGG